MSSDGYSPEFKRTLAKKLGLDPDEWDSNDPEIRKKFHDVFLGAQFKPFDVDGKILTVKEFQFLAQVTGRSH